MVKTGVVTEGEASAYCEAVNHSIAQSKKWEEKIQSTIAVLESLRKEQHPCE
jgi:polyhydroxyalkanoate synthesis regulator phasin